jgi:inosose dehydratase
MFNRREFLAGVSALAMCPRPAFAAGNIQFGCAAITWGGNDRQAIDDIAAAGYRGIQLRSNVLDEFGSRPTALRELLQARRLPLVALSSGNLEIDPGAEKTLLDLHTNHAKFVRDVGGSWLQIIDERPKDRAITADDYHRVGHLLTELGKRTADIGIPLSYHHHMGSIGEKPEAIRAIVAASDPRYVKLQLDTAHYQQGGGDPVAAVSEYGDRLSFLHIKDLQSPIPGQGPDSYRFVELGRGKVDLKGVFTALGRVGFKGWAIVELDSVPDNARTPKESALISKRYLEQRLGLTV